MRLRKNKLGCLKCEKSLEHIGSPDENHPNDAVACYTSGNYGSTVFDPMDESRLEFNICDECLKKAAKKKLVAIHEPVFPPGHGKLRFWDPRG